jgi:quercetin dioxygenase-like cupin family protein
MENSLIGRKTYILVLVGVILLFIINITAWLRYDKFSDTVKDNFIFPQGEQTPATNFTGKAFNLGLVPNDSIYNTLAGNVYFKPGARTNWHLHPSGQILIITDGIGYHQIKGQPRQTIKRGDVITCPPNVLHWHGASSDHSLSQLYIVPNTEKGIVEWKQPVTEDEYITLK